MLLLLFCLFFLFCFPGLSSVSGVFLQFFTLYRSCDISVLSPIRSLCTVISRYHLAKIKPIGCGRSQSVDSEMTIWRLSTSTCQIVVSAGWPQHKGTGGNSCLPTWMSTSDWLTQVLPATDWPTLQGLSLLQVGGEDKFRNFWHCRNCLLYNFCLCGDCWLICAQLYPQPQVPTGVRRCVGPSFPYNHSLRHVTDLRHSPPKHGSKISVFSKWPVGHFKVWRKNKL